MSLASSDPNYNSRFREKSIVNNNYSINNNDNNNTNNYYHNITTSQRQNVSSSLSQVTRNGQVTSSVRNATVPNVLNLPYSIDIETMAKPGIEKVQVELLAHKYAFEGKKSKLKSVLKKSNN